MTKKTATKENITKKPTEKSEDKTCFVIMPISDMDGYDKDHFKRVYEYLIKPACEDAGYTPIRADKVASSNYIVIDILSRIVESDLVVCDLSGRNPNVLYELGVRQAFNLPTVLLKDDETDRIFDIQGLRTLEYSPDLRVDTVAVQIKKIATAINETMAAKGNDVNSLVQLLSVKPAKLPSATELSGETSAVLAAIKELSSRMLRFEQISNQKRKQFLHTFPNSTQDMLKGSIGIGEDGKWSINGYAVDIGDTLYDKNLDVLGSLVAIDLEQIFIKRSDGATVSIDRGSELFNEIQLFPF